MLTEIRTEQSSRISQENVSSQILRDRGNSSAAAFSPSAKDQLSFSQEARTALSRKQAQASQSTEDFVTASTQNLSQEKDKSISWAHGTYHAGRIQRPSFGSNNFGASGTDKLPLAKEQQQAFAAHSYSRMSRQGVMPTSLAPNGTGISLSV